MKNLSECVKCKKSIADTCLEDAVRGFGEVE